MAQRTIELTATYPFDIAFSPDPEVAERQLAEFMRRACDKIVAIGCPDLNDEDPVAVDEIMSLLDLEGMTTNDKGLQIAVCNRDVAERLFAAGLLDQGREEISARWGSR